MSFLERISIIIVYFYFQPKLTNIFKVARLVFVGPNRTILKKGHQPQNMYFVIGGMAVSRRDEKSEQIHQEEIENTVYIIPGCKFADINLFFGEPINYSVWTGDRKYFFRFYLVGPENALSDSVEVGGNSQVFS